MGQAARDPQADAAVSQGLEEAAHALLSPVCSAFPLERFEELLAAVQGPAVQAVLEQRLEQIVKHGHDREHDDGLPIFSLPRLVKEFAGMALETIDAMQERKDLKVARKRLVRVAALALAAIDRLDPVIAAEEAKGGNK